MRVAQFILLALWALIPLLGHAEVVAWDGPEQASAQVDLTAQAIAVAAATQRNAASAE